jgi:hypothetical protein
MTPKELPIPPVAAADPKAMELLRVWAANKAQHVTLPSHLWNDPGSWGIMLVDLVKHVANAYAISRGDDRAEVLTRIRQVFDAEWVNATNTPSGELLD